MKSDTGRQVKSGLLQLICLNGYWFIAISDHSGLLLTIFADGFFGVNGFSQQFCIRDMPVCDSSSGKPFPLWHIPCLRYAGFQVFAVSV
jgi:hypothetical protein